MEGIWEHYQPDIDAKTNEEEAWKEKDKELFQYMLGLLAVHKRI